MYFLLSLFLCIDNLTLFIFDLRILNFENRIMQLLHMGLYQDFRKFSERKILKTKFWILYYCKWQQGVLQPRHKFTIVTVYNYWYTT